ncbi:hypothetical protein M758_7G123200 [Ceratodon purpureus]|nr:hypothetical protein M758_7G123200 [Ceratodon purpureus]
MWQLLASSTQLVYRNKKKTVETSLLKLFNGCESRSDQLSQESRTQRTSQLHARPPAHIEDRTACSQLCVTAVLRMRTKLRNRNQGPPWLVYLQSSIINSRSPTQRTSSS